MNNKTPGLWAIVPAAGVGKRMGGDVPKQYLELNGLALIAWTVNRLLELSALQALVVVISAEDNYWRELEVSNDKRVQTVIGGSERCHSILNGLMVLQGKAADEDWVLVHDAARPCVRISDMRQLIQTCAAADQGGILATPVSDTIKKSIDNNRVECTVNRDFLWKALTPQLFKYAELRHALRQALDDGLWVTDESSAMEHVGYQPLLVEGANDNIKVTVPGDLGLAGFFIRSQEAAC